MNFRSKLAVSALVIAVAFCGFSATASATVWKKEGKNLASLAELTLGGIAAFYTPTGLIVCSASFGTMTTEGGSTAKIASMSYSTCEGEYDFKGCVIKVEARGLPWAVTVNTESTLAISNMKLRHIISGCAASTFEKTVATTTVALTSPYSINKMGWVGSAEKYGADGEFAVTPANVYGIG
jgi:hypothetical protein